MSASALPRVRGLIVLECRSLTARRQLAASSLPTCNGMRTHNSFAAMPSLSSQDCLRHSALRQLRGPVLNSSGTTSASRPVRSVEPRHRCLWARLGTGGARGAHSARRLRLMYGCATHNSLRCPCFYNDPAGREYHAWLPYSSWIQPNAGALHRRMTRTTIRPPESLRFQDPSGRKLPCRMLPCSRRHQRQAIGQPPALVRTTTNIACAIGGRPSQAVRRIACAKAATRASLSPLSDSSVRCAATFSCTLHGRCQHQPHGACRHPTSLRQIVLASSHTSARRAHGGARSDSARLSARLGLFGHLQPVHAPRRRQLFLTSSCNQSSARGAHSDACSHTMPRAAISSTWPP